MDELRSRQTRLQALISLSRAESLPKKAWDTRPIRAKSLPIKADRGKHDHVPAMKANSVTSEAVWNAGRGSTLV